MNRLSDSEKEALYYAWEDFWARPEQLEPTWNYYIWLYLAGRGSGKALALDTPIPTVNGWTSMGDIKVGDIVFDESGQQCNVTYISPIMFGNMCYEIVFSDGTRIVADADHEWLTETKASRKAYGRAINPTTHPSVITTQQIKDTLITSNGRERNHSISVCKPIECDEIDLPIDPYVFGIWLGDGDSVFASITTEDYEIIEEIEDLVTNWNTLSGNRYSIRLNDLPRERDWDGRYEVQDSVNARLHDLKVINNKHIPLLYLRSSIDQRYALLQGLMDSDGYAGEFGVCEYTSTNKRLAGDVLELCLSLGIKARMSEGKATINGRDCGSRYRILFTPRFDVFRLERKLQRLYEPYDQYERVLRRYIIAVNEYESVPMRCIQVDSSSHMFLVSKSFVPTHNTRTGAEWIRKRSRKYPLLYMVGRTAGDMRDVMVEGPSGILSICPRDERPAYEPSKRRLTWPNGSRTLLRSADQPDSLRGPQSYGAWCDELAAWRFDDAWDQVQFGVRLGDAPQIIVTTTPKPTKIIKELAKDSTTHVTEGSMYDNIANLSLRFIERMQSRYEGTRLGRQEIHGKILDDNPNALWNRDMLAALRVNTKPDLVRVVIGVDPGVGSKATSAETGIIVAGLGSDGHGYIIDDLSILGKPIDWANEVVTAYSKHQANKVVAERNNGGDLVESNMKSVNDELPVKLIWSSRGKYTRAEPVSSKYEKGLVHHFGHFAELETELCEWEPNTGESPNRLDALVFAITELMIDSKEIHTDVEPSELEQVSAWAIGNSSSDEYDDF